MAVTFCYVVLAHTDPVGMARLVRRIRQLSPSCDIVVRYDDPAYVDPEVIRAAGAVPYLSRVRVGWGDWTQVEMVLGAFAFARGVSDADYFVDVSGQDYPIRDLRDWEGQVQASGADAVLDPLPTQAQNYRLRWSIRTLPTTGHDLIDRGARFAVNRIGHALAPTVRLHTSDRPADQRVWLGISRSLLRAEEPMPVTKSSEWLTFGRAALDEVLRRDRHDAETRDFFQHVKIPDESYVPSILHDTPGLSIAYGETTAKHFLPGQANPTWIDLDELAHLQRRSAAPFVRKIPVDVDPEVIEAADLLARRTPEQVRADVDTPGRETDAADWPEQVRADVLEDPLL